MEALQLHPDKPAVWTCCRYARDLDLNAQKLLQKFHTHTHPICSRWVPGLLNLAGGAFAHSLQVPTQGKAELAVYSCAWAHRGDRAAPAGPGHMACRWASSAHGESQVEDSNTSAAFKAAQTWLMCQAANCLRKGTVALYFNSSWKPLPFVKAESTRSKSIEFYTGLPQARGIAMEKLDSKISAIFICSSAYCRAGLQVVMTPHVSVKCIGFNELLSSILVVTV